VVRGAWCVVRGAWCVVRGAWCVEDCTPVTCHLQTCNLQTCNLPSATTTERRAFLKSFDGYWQWVLK
jgi:hypothetical protein